MREAFGAEQLERGEGHGYSGLHVEDAGAPGAALFDSEGHLGQRAKRPDGVEMAEQKDGLFAPTAGGEAGFENVSGAAATMSANGCAEAGGSLRGEVEATVNGSLFVGGGLKFDKGLKEPEKGFFPSVSGLQQIANCVVHSC